ncbi:MAG: hypothetical protein MUF42_01150 [Cytophagaceae bacterium]|jgi:hypothetical protein|nr:hypothetical protein [Cytophagaceae bacterium]
MNRFYLLLLACPFALLAQEDNIKIRFNGFGDFTLGHTFGNPVESFSDSLLQNFGEDPYPKGVNQGIGVPGIDFVNTVFLHENITVQSEVNLQSPRGKSGGPELDIERMYIDYKVSDKIGLQGGLFFTPIGFINRNLYSRAWLMNSVHLFRMAEEEAGYMPNHMIGMNAYGTFQISESFGLKYIVGVGNSRGHTPVENLYGRSFEGYQLTGLLEGIVQGPKDFRFGISGFSNEIPSFKNISSYGISISDVDSNRTFIQENGIVPYLHYSGKRFEILGEYVWSIYSGGGEQKSVNMAVAEIAFISSIKEKRFAPYVRYDFIRIPTGGGPYIGLRESGGIVSRVYEPNLSSIMTGICYDLASFNRIKLEYVTHFVGPYKQHGIVFQTAFGF